ncbi:hypothetical protein ABIB42_003916 [Massilia sp. UYP32]|uniref:hypothetical protein n=1 Tax=Massilia TaxID=149698 RepID=UPI0015A55311|nr:hypothetical protein [Massilia timonae]
MNRPTHRRRCLPELAIDDDDWFEDDHCARVPSAIEGKKWAFSYSVYADGNTGRE